MAAELDDFLARHPDSKSASPAREWLRVLREELSAQYVISSEAPAPESFAYGCDW